MLRSIAAAASGLLALSIALPAFAESSSSASSSSSVSSSSVSSSSSSAMRGPRGIMREVRNERTQRARSTRTSSTLDVACIQTAVAKREASLAQGFSAFSATISEAYSDRAAALGTVWSITDAGGRRLGLKTAWDAFQQSGKGARETLKTARKDAWKLYNAEVKRCGITTTGEEGGEKFDQSI